MRERKREKGREEKRGKWGEGKRGKKGRKRAFEIPSATSVLLPHFVLLI